MESIAATWKARLDDDAPTSHHESLIGRVLGGRYRVIRPIGVGGMGAVFEAEQVDLRRRVALKVLSGVDPLSVARLRREAMTAAALQSQHVVNVFDFHTSPGEPALLIMELLHGESLASLLQRERRLEPSRAARIAIQMLSGLEAAHQVGITHRDIKPSNVWIARAGMGEEHVKLVDFGIAKAVHEPGVHTATGQIVGTPAYLAPEQLRGKGADARSDIHAVGVVLYEMLTGARPWRSTLPLFNEILEYVPPALQLIVPATPHVVSEAVVRALMKAPEARFATAGEMARTLMLAFRSHDSSHRSLPVPSHMVASTDSFEMATGSLAQTYAVPPPAMGTRAPPHVQRPVILLTLAGIGALLLVTAAVVVIALVMVNRSSPHAQASSSASIASTTARRAQLAPTVASAVSTVTARPTSPSPPRPTPSGSVTPPPAPPTQSVTPPSPRPSGKPRPATLEQGGDFFIYSAHEQGLIRAATSKIDACVAQSTGHVENEQIVVYVQNPGGGRPPTFDVAAPGEVSASFGSCVVGVFEGLGLKPREQKTRLRLYYRL